ncbi:MAG: hypothetical protein OXG35_23045, partial [Acidobacteria bacterium]|nr:hypothetical protein [Acidobacteriota bacterium]
MAAPAVVDEVQLARAEGELAAQVRVLHHAGHRLERGPGQLVHLDPRGLVAGRDREVRVSAAQVGPELEDGEEHRLRLVRPEVALPILVEGEIETFEQPRVLREQGVVDRAEADEAARPALPGGAEAEQAHVVGRRVVEGVVDVRGLRDVGAEPADADALLDAGVGDLHQDLAVAALDDGAADHRREQPEHGLDLRPTGKALDRDPVHHRHAGALVQAPAHLAQQAAAGVELVVRGVEQARRHRVAPRRARAAPGLVRAGPRERGPPVAPPARCSATRCRPACSTPRTTSS